MTHSVTAFLRTLLLTSLLTVGLAGTSQMAWAGFDINKASAEEIQNQVPGIGPKKAKAIVTYRKKNGKFKSLQDVQNVPGIGEKTVAKIKKNSGKSLKSAAKKSDSMKKKADKKIASKKDNAKKKAKDSKISYKEKTAKQQKELAKKKKAKSSKSTAKLDAKKKSSLAKKKKAKSDLKKAKSSYK